MKKYVEYEAKVIVWTKRGLITRHEAITRIAGYLQAMVDFGQLPEGRLSSELEIAVKKILEIE